MRPLREAYRSPRGRWLFTWEASMATTPPMLRQPPPVSHKSCGSSPRDWHNGVPVAIGFWLVINSRRWTFIGQPSSHGFSHSNRISVRCLSSLGRLFIAVLAENPLIKAAMDPTLLTHRDFVDRNYLELPVDLYQAEPLRRNAASSPL